MTTPQSRLGLTCVLAYQTAVGEDLSAHSERVWPKHLMHENFDLGPARRRWTTLVSGISTFTAEHLQPTAPPAARGNTTEAHRRCFGTTRSVGLTTCLAGAAATGPHVAQLWARIGQPNKAFPDHMGTLPLDQPRHEKKKQHHLTWTAIPRLHALTQARLG